MGMGKKNKQFKKLRSIRSLMTKKVYTARPTEPLYNLAECMAKKSISCIVIVEKNKPLGIITERDYIKKVIIPKRDPNTTPAKKIMSKPVKTITEDADFVSVYELMKRYSVRRFPVVDKNGHLVGIVTQRDILDGFAEIIKHLDWKVVKMHMMIEDLHEHMHELD